MRSRFFAFDELATRMQSGKAWSCQLFVLLVLVALVAVVCWAVVGSWVPEDRTGCSLYRVNSTASMAAACRANTVKSYVLILYCLEARSASASLPSWGLGLALASFQI